LDRRAFLSLLGWTGLAASAAPLADASSPRTLVTRIALIGSRVVVAVTIGGAGPFLFLLDTGGFLSVIDEALARSLKLRREGSIAAAGVGGRDLLPLYLAEDVVFGGGLRQPTVAFAGLSQGFGQVIRGSLAAGVLTTIDSDLDFEAGEWRLYPDGRPPRQGYVRMARGIDELDSKGSPRLFGTAAVNGRPFRFLLDTGAPSGLGLTRAAAGALGLWDDSRPFAPIRTRGIGGEGGIGRLVRAESIELAGRRFERPIILLRNDETAPRREIDGIIGLDLLRGFNLSTDVRARELWLQPRARFTFADRYGLSGLWLDQKGPGVEVADVGTGSPAQKAGLQVGDRLKGSDLATLVRRISGPPGTSVTLSVVRDGAVREVRFTLAEYL
jgi:hypothetical protein